MIGNVQILKNSGDTLLSNGLAHFKLNDSGNEFIIYYLGEETEDGKKKIHIGLVTDDQLSTGISEDDGQQITTALKMIGKGEDSSPIVTFLPLSAQQFKIHDKEKKLGVPEKVINNLISVQQASQIKTNAQDDAVIKENTFFDSSLVAAEESAMPETPTEESIFAKPLQPVIEETTIEEPAQIPVQEEAIEMPQVANEVIAASPVQTPVEEPIVEAASVEPTPVVNEVNPSVIAEDVKETDDKIISFEQAKETIARIQELNKELNDKIITITNYVNQQENKSVVNEIVSPSNEVASIPVQTEEVAMDSVVTSLPEQFDVVKSLELAPEADIVKDSLEAETDLSNDYSVSVPDASIASTINLNSGISTDVEIPASTGGGTVTPQVIEQVVIEPTPQVAEVPQVMDAQAISQPAEVNITPAYIDTPQMIDTSLQTGSTGNVEMIDTSAMLNTDNMVIDTALGSTTQTNTIPTLPDEPVIIDNYSAGAEVNNVPVQMTTPEPINTNDTVDISYQESQNLVENSNMYGNVAPTPAMQEQAVAPVPSQEPAVQTVEIPNVNNANMEYQLPQIDMDVSKIPTIEQPPVTIPDGQTPDISGDLVTGPEAFEQKVLTMKEAA